MRTVDEIQMSRQEQILGGVVSVAEILVYVESDRYLILKEAAAYLGISKRTLRDSDAPRYRIGTKMLLFKKSELDFWMLQHREGGDAELDDLVSSTLAKVLGD